VSDISIDIIDPIVDQTMNLHLTIFVSGIAPLLFLLTTTASGTFIESEQSDNFDIIYDKPAYCTTANYDCYV
jgi:hypothetical protein